MIAIEIMDNITFLSRYEHDKHESNIDIQNYCFPLPDRREETNFPYCFSFHVEHNKYLWQHIAECRYRGIHNFASEITRCMSLIVRVSPLR
jgi:hypothetical protein